MFNFMFGGIDFSHKLDAASSPTEDYFKHVHSFNEVLFCVSGDVLYTVESEARLLAPGDLVLIPPGKYHFATVNPDVGYERYVLKFPDALLPSFLSERLQDMKCFYSIPLEQASLFKGLDEFIEFGNFSDEEIFTLFLGEIVKLLIMLSKSMLSDAESETNSLIADVVRYIDENIRRPITLESLSVIFHFSKSYICNEFKRYMKISIMQYVRMKKIVAAQRCIMAGEKKSSVAEQFGFRNYSTFYRQYMKQLKEELPLLPRTVR